MFKTLLLSFTLPLSNAKKILWTGRHHFANTLSYIIAVLLLGNLPFSHGKDIFCSVFGEVHGLTSSSNFIPALSIAALNKHCWTDASLRLVSGFMEGILLGMQRLETWALFLALERVLIVKANMWYMCHHCPFPKPQQTSIIGSGICFHVTSGHGPRALLNSWQPLLTTGVDPWIQPSCHLQLIRTISCWHLSLLCPP